MISPILIVIVFIIIFILIQKFQKKSIASLSAQAQKSDPFETLAAQLNLHYEHFSPEANKNTVFSNGSRMHGTYNTFPVEAIYAVSTRTESALTRFSASYNIQKTITFTVQNPKNIFFQIVPKILSAEGGRPTGNILFDEKLLLVGDVHLPPEFLEYCAGLGWMNLTLKGNTLVFNDTFYDEMQGLGGTMNIMSTVHPIWKSTATNTAIDIASSKKLFDELVIVAESL